MTSVACLEQEDVELLIHLLEDLLGTSQVCKYSFGITLTTFPQILVSYSADPVSAFTSLHEADGDSVGGSGDHTPNSTGTSYWEEEFVPVAKILLSRLRQHSHSKLTPP